MNYKHEIHTISYTFKAGRLKYVLAYFFHTSNVLNFKFTPFLSIVAYTAVLF